MDTVRYVAAAFTTMLALGTAAFAVSACGEQCDAACASSAKAVLEAPIPASGLNSLAIELCINQECITAKPAVGDAGDASLAPDSGASAILQGGDGRARVNGLALGSLDGRARIELTMSGIAKLNAGDNVTIRVSGRDLSNEALLFAHQGTVKAAKAEICGDSCGHAEATFENP
jgi:hypothetical protein